MKKMIFLPVALVALMAMSCGTSTEEVAVEETVVEEVATEVEAVVEEVATEVVDSVVAE